MAKKEIDFNDMVEVLSGLDFQTTFEGYKLPDKNIKGNFLLLETQELFYSFKERDIIKEEKLGNGRIKVTLRSDAIGLKTQPIKLTLNVGLVEAFELNLPPVPLYRKGDPKMATVKDRAELRRRRPTDLSLAAVAGNFTAQGSCKLGNTSGQNNCAHYLSDAFIRTGYTELLRRNSAGGGIFNAWCDIITPPGTVNLDARPIRALQMKNWFISKATSNQTTKPKKAGFWAVFQSDPSYPSGHVLIYDSDADVFYGTGAYWNWNVQHFYKW